MRKGKIVLYLQQKRRGGEVALSRSSHTDWVRYGKVMPEFFQGSIGADTLLLSMLIRVDKHPQLLGAISLHLPWLRLVQPL